MPARIHRYVLNNSMQGHRLDLVKKHLCWGDWTPGGWEPPAAIPSGATGGMQAESDGILTGTEGWVKYRVTREADGAARALAYLYWDNPYLGVTNFRFALVGMDIKADCDDDDEPASGESTFTEASGDNEPPNDMRLMVTGTRRNGVPTTADEIADLYRVPLAPIFIFGTAGIWERMEVDVDLASVSIPTPGFSTSIGKRTRTLEKHPRYDDWSGEWSDGTVSVDISSQQPAPVAAVQMAAFHDRNLLHVGINDRTPGWQQRITADCALANERSDGSLAAVRAPGIWDGIVDAVAASDIFGTQPDIAAKASVAASAVKHSAAQVESSTSVKLMEHPMSTHAYSTALRASAVRYGVEASPLLDTVTSAAAAQIRFLGNTLFPAPGTTLQLYREMEDGQQRGVSLRYLRTAPDGRVIVDRYLGFNVPLH